MMCKIEFGRPVHSGHTGRVRMSLNPFAVQAKRGDQSPLFAVAYGHPAVTAFSGSLRNGHSVGEMPVRDSFRMVDDSL